MPVKVYPSRFEGEPLEVHETRRRMSVLAWFEAEVPGFRWDAPDHPFTVCVRGGEVPVGEWHTAYFDPSDEVTIHAEPRGYGALVMAVVALVAVVAVMLLMPTPGSSNQQQGRRITEPGASANRKRYGEPVPEIFGAPIVYPDYLLPPRRFYQNDFEQWIEMFLNVGKGEFATDVSEVRIGATRIVALGDDVEAEFFAPNADLTGVAAAEWWHSPEEVGFTSFSNAGMTLREAEGVTILWTDALSFTGDAIVGEDPVPDAWETGMHLTVSAAYPTVFGSNWLANPLLDRLPVSVGDTLDVGGSRAGAYVVSAILPPSVSSPGAAATLTGSAPPLTLVFPEQRSMTVRTQGVNSVVTATGEFASVDALATHFNSQLNSGFVRFRVQGGALEVYQIQPYRGGTIVALGDDVDLFLGADPESVPGVPLTESAPRRYEMGGVELVPGVETAVVGWKDSRFEIVEIPHSHSVRVVPAGETAWLGFPPGALASSLLAELAPDSREGGWIGPFAVAPEGGQCDAFEIDVLYPSGLVWFNDKGRARQRDSAAIMQWRYIGESAWTETTYREWRAEPNTFGLTHRTVLPAPGRVEVRVRAMEGPDPSSNTQNTIQWVGLRGRVVGAPLSYPWTTMRIRMRSGDRMSSGVENKVSLRATRILPGVGPTAVNGPTRDIAPAVQYLLRSAGYGEGLVNYGRLAQLHGIWAARNDTFDLAVESASTIKAIANFMLAPGFTELTLRDGLVDFARDVSRRGLPPRIFSDQMYVKGSPLTEISTTPQPDDIDGVDAEYVDFVSGRTATVEFRLEGDLGERVETIKVPGVTSPAKARILAARRRRIQAYRRTEFQGETEMQALNTHYLDFVGLQDGVPGWAMSAFVVDASGASLWLSEPLQWDPEVVDLGISFVRRDGTVTAAQRIVSVGGDKRVIGLEFPPAITMHFGQDGSDATIVHIGTVEHLQRPALIASVEPRANGRTGFTAWGYDERVYVDDGADPLPTQWLEGMGDLVLWLDAADTSTVVEISGRVSQVFDRSQAGNDAWQNVARLRPVRSELYLVPRAFRFGPPHRG